MTCCSKEIPSMFDPLLLLSGAETVVVCGAVGSLALACYQKCGPDTAMIISGLLSGDEGGPKFKVVTNGGAVIWPVIQQRAFLSLAPMQINITAKTPFITK